MGPFAADDVEVDIAALPGHIVDDGAEQPFPPARPGGFPEDDFGDVARARELEDFLDDVLAAQGHRFSAQLFGQLEGAGEPVFVFRGLLDRGRGLHMDRDPFRFEAGRQARRRPDQARRHGTAGYAHEEPLAHQRNPGVRDALGGMAHGQLAQSHEVRGLKEIFRRALGLFAHIDFAFFQALQEVFGRDVDQFQIVRPFKEGVRHRFPDLDARDLGDEVVQAFPMLDVQGRVDADAGVQELFDVLPAFGMARSGGVGMGEFIDQDKLGLRARAPSISNSLSLKPL